MNISASHEVVVTVDAKKNVMCNPEQISVLGCDSVLKFLLQTDGYVFPQDAAVVVANPAQEFPEPSKTLPPNAMVATLFDRTTGPGTFQYTVTVQKVSTGELFKHDPMIDNGP